MDNSKVHVIKIFIASSEQTKVYLISGDNHFNNINIYLMLTLQCVSYYQHPIHVLSYLLTCNLLYDNMHQTIIILSLIVIILKVI